MEVCNTGETLPAGDGLQCGRDESAFAPNHVGLSIDRTPKRLCDPMRILLGPITAGLLLIGSAAVPLVTPLESQTSSTHESRNPPVILVSIDTLRADHLGAYGYRRIRTPELDAFAEHGTLFANASAQVPLTLPSHTSLFTSTYPFENGIEENAETVPPGQVTLASVLQSRGYKTAAFIGSVFLEREMGLDQGFQTYDSPFHFTAFSPLSGSMFFGGAQPGPRPGGDRRDGALVVRAALQWLAANHGQPVFAFVHLYDLHTPYRHSAGASEGASVAGYDTELAYLDKILGTFRRALVANGWWDRSVVILLSDHGESLGDHGEGTHGYFIYQSTLHVPLVVHWPAGQPALPSRVDSPVGLIDVAPTVLDFLHIPAPGSFEGISLLRARASHPNEPSEPVYAESLHTRDAFGWAALRSIRSGDFKYIAAPKPELYNLQADPREQVNLARKDPARAQTLREQLGQLLARHAPKRSSQAIQTSPQTRAVLGSLGYLSAGPGMQRLANGADPKDKLPEFQMYEEAMVHLYNRRLERAAALLRHIVAADPRNTLARRDLGGCYMELKQYGKARESLQTVLTAAPDDYMTQFELGIADERLGFLKEAVSHLQTACRLAPEAAQCRHELDTVQQQIQQRGPASRGKQM